MKPFVDSASDLLVIDTRNWFKKKKDLKCASPFQASAPAAWTTAWLVGRRLEQSLALNSGPPWWRCPLSPHRKPICTKMVRHTEPHDLKLFWSSEALTQGPISLFWSTDLQLFLKQSWFHPPTPTPAMITYESKIGVMCISNCKKLKVLVVLKESKISHLW